jgi:hypothetical protein
MIRPRPRVSRVQREVDAEYVIALYIMHHFGISFEIL